jgi:CD109 antigen
VDVQVEEYVLPKYEVNIDLSRSWVLANEPITGKVSAQYTFGKPVTGEVEIVASRYVGKWEEFATLTRPLDGQVEFQLPPARYVAGVPGAQGMGNVTLLVTVREKATGYEGKSTRLLTVAASPVNLRVIPESTVFKPSLPFSFLVVTETPDGQPVDKEVQITLFYLGKDFEQVNQKSVKVNTRRGRALVRVAPPADSVALNLEATSEQAHTSLTLQSSYSPSGHFIHLEQTTEELVKVGDVIAFHVASTRETANFYYEVVSRGVVVFSSVSTSPDILLTTTPLMAPSARLLVYQILPNNEVAADYLPFKVAADYPHHLTADFSQNRVGPGDAVDINLQAQGPSRVGLVAVDRSVFILAEDRLNLQQVFDQLERLYQEPQVELHEARFLNSIATRGASETFRDAGLVVMTNKQVPDGEKYQRKGGRGIFALGAENAARAPAATPVPVVVAAPVPSPSGADESAAPAGLAQVQRVRQFFPETWLWTDVTTDSQGKATLHVEAPDNITTWVLRAVGLSKEQGLGIAESHLRVFQPFFLQADLPYSAIRGEEFPVKVALYNYLPTPQEIFVELEGADWFTLLDPPLKSVTIGASDIGGVEFRIQPTALGNKSIKVTARSREAADAVVKDLLVEPEGVSREEVGNLVLSGGRSREIRTQVPSNAIEGSGRAYLALTGSYLTQTIEGLERLLQMPFGCGEQNMVLFAPNVFIARYLKETGQLKPEVMARAEHLMITGYQRELTYRRNDGSFSAFGNQDREGSLWLTAFVLKTFSQARALMFIDQGVLDGAAAWIDQQQRADGSFEPVGFLHHQELLGGLRGNQALTAYVAVALQEAGKHGAAARAVKYLEGKLNAIDDAYTMAIVTYALEVAASPRAGEAYNKLMSMAHESEEGLYWGDELPILGSDGSSPLPPRPNLRAPIDRGHHSAAIETSGYATLALLEHGDRLNASRAARWLVSQRNAYGGFGSTQDTVVGLQALTAYATGARAEVNMVVKLESEGWRQEVRISPENADVLQMVQVPLGQQVLVAAEGKGEAVLQWVLRYNLPQLEQTKVDAFQISVEYSTDHVEVDDLITVSAKVRFNPPEPVEAGMVVLDIAVPTGFAPVSESIASLVNAQPKVKRYDVVGRKVVLYIEDMRPGESLNVAFQARALYPVQARGVVSQAYSYYRPEWKGQTLGDAMTVVAGGGGR